MFSSNLIHRESTGRIFMKHNDVIERARRIYTSTSLPTVLILKGSDEGV
jgi:hypothetical protein